MLNTSNNDNINTITLKLIKHPVPDYFSILIQTRLQRVTLTKRKAFSIFHPSGQEDVYIFIRSRNRGLKAPPLSYRA